MHTLLCTDIPNKQSDTSYIFCAVLLSLMCRILGYRLRLFTPCMYVSYKIANNTLTQTYVDPFVLLAGISR